MLKCSKPVARQSQVLPVRASRRFKKARKRVRQAQAPWPVFFVEAPSRPVVLVSCRPPPTDGAQDARGPKGPTGLDASRHRGLSKRLLVPQVRQTQSVPRAVFEACSAPSPGGRPFVTQSEEPVRDSPPLNPGHSTGGHADWTTGLPAVRGLGVRDRHAGIMRGTGAASPTPAVPGHRTRQRGRDTFRNTYLRNIVENGLCKSFRACEPATIAAV